MSENRRVYLVVEDQDNEYPALPQEGEDRRINLIEKLSPYQADELAQGILYLTHHQLGPASKELSKSKEKRP